MSEVLVVVDHVDGAIRKPTYELLTLARKLGEPAAVFFGAPDKGAEAAAKLGQYGAEKVYVVDDAEIKGYLVAPKAEALAAARREGVRRRRCCSSPATRARRSPAAWRSRSAPA